jgi:tryptophan synthase alpha chain
VTRRLNGATGFIPYITAGCPSLETTREIACTLAACGADVLEIGIPFSDPLADGPIIQEASHRALDRGVTVRDVLETVHAIRATSDIPIVLMTYVNPILAFGADRFPGAAARAGVDGILLSDVPPEEEPILWDACAREGIARIHLVAPTSPPARRRFLASRCTGFVYVLSRLGITGTDGAFDPLLPEIVSDVRGTTEIPVAVGFGVQRAEQVATLKRTADAVVVGSALMRIVMENERDPVSALESWARDLANVLHSACDERTKSEPHL